MRHSISCVSSQKAIVEASTEEKNRGRLEQRILCIYDVPKVIREGWPSVGKIITVRRIRTDKDKTTDSLHYYITSLKSNDPMLYLELIRRHWWVENKLHHVKDVVMHEDYTKFVTYDRVKKNGLFRNIAFNCIKFSGLDSIKYTLEKCAANIKFIFKLIRT